MALNLRRHWAYCKYLVRHKWCVFRACLRTGAGPWCGLVHDLSKLLPDEWYPYARAFYAPDGAQEYLSSDEFDEAWRNQRRNRHHWQYWTLFEDRGGIRALWMPDVFVREMVADWIGAGQALGKPDARLWYRVNRDNMMLAPSVRAQVERLLEDYYRRFPCQSNETNVGTSR